MPFLAAAAPYIGAAGAAASAGGQIANSLGGGSGGQAPVPMVSDEGAGWGGTSQEMKDYDKAQAQGQAQSQALQQAWADYKSGDPFKAGEADKFLKAQGINPRSPTAQSEVEKQVNRISSDLAKMPKPESPYEARMKELHGLSGDYRNRQLIQADMGDYNKRMDAYNATGAAQDDAMGLAKSAAEGNQPSAAEMMMRQGQDQANMAAAAQAASARGGGGNLALANRSAQRQQMAGNQQALQSAGVVRAQEMATARAQYAQQALQRRVQALQAAGMSADVAFKQAQLEQQSREANDRYGLAYDQMYQNQGQSKSDQEVAIAQGNQKAATTGRGQNMDADATRIGAIRAGIKEGTGTAGNALARAGQYWSGSSSDSSQGGSGDQGNTNGGETGGTGTPDYSKSYF